MLAVTGGMALCRPFQTVRLQARPHAVPSTRLQIVAARAKGKGKGEKANNGSLEDDKKGGKKLKKQKKQLKACATSACTLSAIATTLLPDCDRQVCCSVISPLLRAGYGTAH